MEQLKERLNKISGGRVLDVGSGVGEFISILKDELKDYSEIIGIDNYDKALETAQNRFKEENIKMMKMDAEKIQFQDNSIDTVCISNTLHHLPNINKVFQEMKRVLKPGGTFIINEMFCDNQSEKQLTHVYLHHFGADIDTLTGRWCHNRTFKKQEIMNIANKEGIKILDSLEYTYNEEETEEEELKKELESISQVVDKRVESIKKLPQYEEYKDKGEEIKERLYEIGLAGATELMIIGTI